MSYRFLLGVGVALAAALSCADARAQAWYFGGEGGWTDLEDQSGSVAGVKFTEKWDNGFNVGARGGYEWGPWRFEGEYRYQQSGLSGSGFGGIPGTTGDRDAHALMANAIYDFTFGWPITPHLGAGIGAVNLREGVSLAPPIKVPGGPTVGGSLIHDNQWEFGYQAIAGIRYNINPALAFDLDYRYLGTTDPTFKAVNGASVKSGYSTHNILASLSLRFGPPPPPPVQPPPVTQAPPPVGQRTYLVFFDWDKDTITPDGMQIVQQAAAAYRAGGPVRIMVTGYTDRSGSPGYNQRLSERRANNVANALARFGVARTDMAVSGRGENDNRVPTAPGVREPQNRRVEIVLP